MNPLTNPIDFSTIFDEREMKVLEEAMAKKDMSARAVVRHFFRMGQMTDLMQDKGYRVLYTKDDEVFDPLNVGPKMAPMPEDLSRFDNEGGAPVKELSCGCDVGNCICDIET